MFPEIAEWVQGRRVEDKSNNKKIQSAIVVTSRCNKGFEWILEKNEQGKK